MARAAGPPPPSSAPDVETSTSVRRRSRPTARDPASSAGALRLGLGDAEHAGELEQRGGPRQPRRRAAPARSAIRDDDDAAARDPGPDPDDGLRVLGPARRPGPRHPARDLEAARTQSARDPARQLLLGARSGAARGEGLRQLAQRVGGGRLGRPVGSRGVERVRGQQGRRGRRPALQRERCHEQGRQQRQERRAIDPCVEHRRCRVRRRRAITLWRRISPDPGPDPPGLRVATP
jgi:hypothetical protein